MELDPGSTDTEGGPLWSWGPTEASLDKSHPVRGTAGLQAKDSCPKPGRGDGQAPLWAALHEYHFPKPCPRRTGSQCFGVLLEANGLRFQSHKQWEKPSMVRPPWRVGSLPPDSPPAPASSRPPLSHAMTAKGYPDPAKSTWHLVAVVSLLYHQR